MPDNRLPAVLEEIRERADAATPGPWESDILVDCGNRPVVLLPDPDNADAADLLFAADAPSATEADAEFIAHAREDVPRLLAVVDAALKLADKYDAESKRLWGQIRDADRRGVMTGSRSIDAAWNGDVAKAIREAITRELTGGDHA
jgi:hypothetical protein